MTQPFADALSWVPKSRALGATLGRAHDLARAQNHPAVTLEHLLLALIEDPDASSVLLSCNIDLLKLNAAAAEYMQAQPAGSSEMPEAAPALKTILEYAVAAARQSRRSEINGAIVLAAVIGEGKSEAATLLAAAGLKFQDAVAALKRATAPPAPRQSAAEPQSPPPPETPHQPEPETPPHQAPAAPALETVQAAEAPPSPPQRAHDDDPVTTARLRIAAIRSGQTPPPLAVNGSHHAPHHAAMADGNAAVALAPDDVDGAVQRPRPAAVGPGGDWAPAAAPPAIPAGTRPIRMPPPVPPVAEAPVRRTDAAADTVAQARAPWSDQTMADPPPVPTASAPSRPGTSPHPSRPPLDTSTLVDWIPEKMSIGAKSTIDIHIPRASILASTPGPGPQQGRSAILTRTLAVRLRAPSGGFMIENASPETQWFDQKPTQIPENDIRWRWVVTPQTRGRHPLQLSFVMRSVASDGLISETVLPDRQAIVRVGGNMNALGRKMASWGLAAFVGAVLTLLASVGLAGLLAGVFK